MPEYFYTLDLGRTYGPKLEILAAQVAYDDVEAFAAMILCCALDQMEAEEERIDALRNACVDEPTTALDLDDDIPF